MVIPDLPGFGETPPLRGRHSVAAMAEFLEEFRDAIGLKLFDLGGLCLGATVALELARRHPEQVRQLVLHTPIYSHHALSRWARLQLTLFANPVVFPVGALVGRRRFVSDLYKRLFIEGADVDPVDATVNFENQRRCSPRAAREWMMDSKQQDYEEWLHRWEQPVLMVVASDDALCNLAAMQRLTETMRTGEVVVIPEAGHGWTEALVRAQAAAISGFLAPEAI